MYMKKKQLTLLLSASLTLGLGLSSCSKFLDVQPAGTTLATVQFSTLQGYYDAMYGVYATMAAEPSYGRALTYGLADMLGQQLANLNTSLPDRDVLAYDYSKSPVKSQIDALWANQYTTISYLNSLLSAASSSTLPAEQIQKLRGEALGLRAFLHFDMLKLFAQDYRLGPQERGIPYSYNYDLSLRQLYNVSDSYANILRDLDEAETLLASDEQVEIGTASTHDFWSYRAAHFNKYAVYATKARVYRMMGDYTNAAKYARLVIEHTQNFSLPAASNYADTRRFPNGRELVFGLFSKTYEEGARRYFLNSGGNRPGAVGSGQDVEGRKDLARLYRTSSFTGTNRDQRYGAFFRTQGTILQFIRFADGVARPVIPNNERGIALIRLPEMYYILSEALYDTDKAAAVAALNTVRVSRGLAELEASSFLSREAFERELMDEYMREFVGEGQTFYSLKHFNRSFNNFFGNEVRPSAAIFVLPWNDTELELGNH